MQLNVKGKNLEVSDSIRSYVERKLGKLSRQLSDLAEVDVELAVEKNPRIAENQVAEATVRVKGHTLHAHESSVDMKTSIDALTQKLLRQVKTERDKKTLERRRHVDKPAVDGETPDLPA